MFIRPALLTLLLSLCMPLAQAQSGVSYRLSAGNAVSLDAAVQQVKQQTDGRILTANTVNKNGTRVHRIKVLLPDGTVKVILINAE